VKAIHEHEWEAAPGLPEALPPGETLLWQGRPDVWRLAIDAFHVRKIALYFVVLLAWQQLSLMSDGLPWADRLLVLLQSFTLALIPLCLLGMAAWWAASTTLYSVTDKRVIMRIGIVLSLTLNLPFRRLRAADLKLSQDGHGDIALALPDTDRMGWFHLWPHQRAWHVRHPQPTLRAVPRAQEVGDLIRMHWQLAHADAHLRLREPTAQTGSTTWPGDHEQVVA
jgi:hypothetical protein